MLTINATDDQVLEMGKLAVLASRPVGMGFLHYQSGLTKEMVELEIQDGYNPGLFIDYYQGRMVKFQGWKKGERWEFHDTIDREYQSWIAEYPSYQALFEAACAVL
jgi:hypothetical protein